MGFRLPPRPDPEAKARYHRKRISSPSRTEDPLIASLIAAFLNRCTDAGRKPKQHSGGGKATIRSIIVRSVAAEPRRIPTVSVELFQNEVLAIAGLSKGLAALLGSNELEEQMKNTFSRIPLEQLVRLIMQIRDLLSPKELQKIVPVIEAQILSEPSGKTTVATILPKEWHAYLKAPLLPTPSGSTESSKRGMFPIHKWDKNDATSLLLKDLGFSHEALQDLMQNHQFEKDLHKAVSALTRREFYDAITKNRRVTRELGLKEIGLHMGQKFDGVSPDEFLPMIPEIERRLIDWVKARFTSVPVRPSRIFRSRKEQQDHERRMAQREDTISVAQDGTLLKGGIRYRSLYAAAPLAQTHPTTLLNWIKNGILVNGRALQAFYFAPAGKHFISEESIERSANRFIRWPSNKPATAVTVGRTKDRSGYIGLPDAREILGITSRTMYLWATRHKAPREEPLDVIKDPISKHLFIREKDVYDLKKLIPKRGLHRGRRPQPRHSPA